MKDTEYQIERYSSTPIYKQVKEYILYLINQSTEDSTLLPPEIEISKQFDISRATVRTAIMELVQEGVLERVPGKGTFIRERPNTLRFANWLAVEEPTTPIVKQLLGEFNQDRDDGFIKNLGISYQEIERQLLILATGGEAPDISALIYLWTPLLAYNGALEPLDSLYSTDLLNDLYPQTIEGVRYEGRYYGLNWINGPTILFYHKDILKEFTGEETLTAEYYEELLDLFERIHEKSSGEIIPFSIPVFDDELFFLNTLSNFLYAFGGGVFGEGGEIIFHSSETQNAFVWLKKFIKKGRVNITNNSWRNRKLFSIGKMAFLAEGPWMRCMIPVLSGRDQSVLEDIGYSTMLKSSTGQTFSVLWNHTLSIFKQCGNKELASEFIKYLALNPRTAERYYKATGMLPVSKRELESNPVYNDALGTVLKKQMETAHPIRVHDPSTFLLSVTICAKAAREILLGDADIAATLNSHAEIVKALQKK